VLDAGKRGLFVDGKEIAVEEAWAGSVTEVLVRIAYGVVELDVVGGTLLAAVGHVAFWADHGCDFGTVLQRGDHED
jgi:hypothetical protein